MLAPLLSLSLLVAAAPAPTTPAPPIWESQFMTAPGRELLAAARAVPAPANAEVLLLFEELVRTFDADGKSHRRYREVYLVLTETGARDWDRVSAGWEPWYEEAPKLHARVVSKDGRVSVLDEKTIETANPGGDDDVYSDGRELRAPLPRVAPGSVVELEVDSSDRTPEFEGGIVDRFYFGSNVPVQKTRLVLEAPGDLPLHIAARKLPDLRRETSTRAGLRVTTLEGGPYPARPRPPAGPPPSEILYPHVAYSTGTSWNQVAARYAKILQRQLAGADLGALARETLAGAKGRDAQASRLLARLDRDVRYTGVEFGESSIVPHPPAEVLEHRYGDCKDKALLLVGLLRAVGINAEVALLRAGFDADVDEDLPGLGRFNHAIVYVPGPQPLWIDATDRFSPVGSLPLGDQGRLALIARADSKTLVRTPRAPASANFTRETREVVLDESGQARITEHSESIGAPAQSMRWDYANTERKKLEERLEGYVKHQYEAKALGKLDFSDPTDIDKPFRLDLTIDGAGVGAVWDAGAQVVLRRTAIFEHLPEMLRDPESTKPNKGDEPRTIDYVFHEPYLYEIRYHIVPPHGFAPDALPPAETTTFATAKLESIYAANPDGSVVATMRFDTGPTRLTAKQLDDFRAAMKSFLAGDAPVVRFSQKGEGHLAAGRVREALAEFRRLDAAHPGTVLHTTQMAVAYLEAGLGEAARGEARRAVAVDPKSSRAQRFLGWILEHDLIGRRFQRGADLPAAARAYRQALTLDDGDDVARGSLAILLEHDEAGGHTWPRAHLRELAGLYERLHKDGETRYDVNRLLGLVHEERWQEVINVGKSLRSSNEIRALVLAATAMISGARGAADAAVTLVTDGSERPEALRMAAYELMRARHYAEASRLFAEAANGHSNGAQLRAFAEQLARTRRHEEVRHDPRDPKGAARAFMMATMLLVIEDSPKAHAQLREMIVDENHESFDRSELVRGFRMGLRATNQKVELGPDVLLDLALAAELAVDGDPRWGVRVRLPVPNDTSFSNNTMVMVPRHGGFRLLCAGRDERALANEALRLAEAGDLPGARFLLDWAVEGASLGTADDPLIGPPLARVWQREGAGDLAAIRLAVAVARADAAGVPALTTCAKSAPTDLARLGCQQASIVALGRAGKAEEALAAATDLSTRYPTSAVAFQQRLYRTGQAKQRQAGRALLEERLRARPDDALTMRVLAGWLVEDGALAPAEALLRKLIALPRPAAADYNELAWMLLMRSDSRAETVELSRKSVQLAGRRNAAGLHTLAALLAETNQVEEARATLIESLDAADRDEPSPSDWYVVGRIAESYGLRDAAREIYRKIARPAQVRPLDAFLLVEKRLHALEGTATATP